MQLGLQGRTALVTAASQGLGRACAEALAAEGARVAICSRSKERITETASEIAATTSATVVGLECDLTKREQVENLPDRVKEQLGPIDILVFNNGNPPSGSFFDIPLKDWQAGLDLCFWPAIQLCRAIAPEMKQRGWGRIVFISSVFAKEPDANFVVSSSLRAGLMALAKCLAIELAPYKCTVNTVLPGYFDTPLLRGLADRESAREGRTTAEVLQSWAEAIPVQSLAAPTALGSLVRFLCTQEAAHITGACLPIDGGLSKGVV